MKNKMRFITTVYGDKYLPMLWAHLQSIVHYYPKVPISIFYEDISEYEIKIIRESFRNCKFIQGPNLIPRGDLMEKIPLKIRYWSIACDTYPDEILCLLDCDTALCSNISSFVDKSFDVLYTWKNERFPLNVGVVIVVSKSSVCNFMKRWLKRIEEILKNPVDFQTVKELGDAIDQYALREILNTQNYDGFIERNIEGEIVRFKGVACKYLNETNSVPITKDTHIIHYKAGWHPIILENALFTKNRPQEACKEMLDYWRTLYREVTRSSVRLFSLASALKYKERFACAVNGYEERGILHSEMLAVCSVVQNLAIDVVVESGRYRGQNTEILAKYFCDTKTKIVSIERNKDENAKYVENKIKNYSNLKLIHGDTNDVIPKILTKHRGRKIAVLFDGPKGEEAIGIFKKAICDFPEVIVGFFHDMRKPTKEMPNPSRNVMENFFDRVFFTDDAEYIASFRYLDEACLPKNHVITEDSWRPWMKGNNKIGSYGPTMAVVIPTEREKKSWRGTRYNSAHTKQNPIVEKVKRKLRQMLKINVMKSHFRKLLRRILSLWGDFYLKHCGLKRGLNDAAEFLGVSVEDLIRRSEKTENETDLEPLWGKRSRENEEEVRDFWRNCKYMIGRQEWYNFQRGIEFEKFVPRGGNFLDYGCETALTAFKLKRKRLDINIYLGDIPETVTKPFAIWRMKKYKLEFKWFDIPIDEKVNFGCKLDFVRCYDVLEHTFHPLATVKNLEKQLKPGGYFLWIFINDPTAYLANTKQAQMQRQKTIEFIENKFEKVEGDIWRKKVLE